MQHRTARQTSRESIHDLRNLFGVVASARHMLDDGPPAERRTLLLEAIEDAAMRGARLTTELLARRRPDRMDEVDFGHHLAGLEPLIDALAGRHAEIRTDFPDGGLPVRFNSADFDAVVLELVANASAAMDASGRIMIRARRIGRRVWLMVADTGCGMTALDLERALRGPAAPSASGTGLARVLQFARTHHGRFHIRSRKGRGTVTFLNLPLVLKTTCVEPAVRPPAGREFTHEENRHEKRQPVAA